VREETLRMHPPCSCCSGWRCRISPTTATSSPRNEPDRLATVTHRIPEVFKDPDRFDPDRYGPGREEDKRRFAFQAFGGGAHKCLGNAFALLQIKAIFAILLRRFAFTPYGDPLESDFHGVYRPKQPCRVTYPPHRTAEGEALAKAARAAKAPAPPSAEARCPMTKKA